MNNDCAKASLKSIKVSPRKLSLVTNLIKNTKVSYALTQLSFCQKRISYDVKKCLQSAVANAEHNLGMDIDNLYILSIEVGKALFAKRVMPRARGRSARVEKKYSRLGITICDYSHFSTIRKSSLVKVNKDNRL